MSSNCSCKPVQLAVYGRTSELWVLGWSGGGLRGIGYLIVPIAAAPLYAQRNSMDECFTQKTSFLPNLSLCLPNGFPAPHVGEFPNASPTCPQGWGTEREGKKLGSVQGVLGHVRGMSGGKDWGMLGASRGSVGDLCGGALFSCSISIVIYVAIFHFFQQNSHLQHQL